MLQTMKITGMIASFVRLVCAGCRALTPRKIRNPRSAQTHSGVWIMNCLKISLMALSGQIS